MHYTEKKEKRRKISLNQKRSKSPSVMRRSGLSVVGLFHLKTRDKTHLTLILKEKNRSLKKIQG